VCLDISSDFSSLALLTFVEFHEVFLVVQYLFEEFFAAGAPPGLLATAHLLLEAVEGAGLFFRRGENLGASVEVPIN